MRHDAVLRTSVDPTLNVRANESDCPVQPHTWNMTRCGPCIDGAGTDAQPLSHLGGKQYLGIGFVRHGVEPQFCQFEAFDDIGRRVTSKWLQEQRNVEIRKNTRLAKVGKATEKSLGSVPCDEQNEVVIRDRYTQAVWGRMAPAPDGRNEYSCPRGMVCKL